jgi:hypothetical protein
MVSLYDEALINKIKNWTRNTNLRIVGPGEARRLFEVIADETNDKPIELPLISITRKGGFSLLQSHKQPITFDGLTLEANIDKSLQLNSVPIRIPYQIDIYTRYLEEADAYVRNFIFNIINFPLLQVKIPYEDKYIPHDSNIKLDTDVEDNSSIPERLISGQFTRYSIGIYVDDAYLWDLRYRDNYLIDIIVNEDGTNHTNFQLNNNK